MVDYEGEDLAICVACGTQYDYPLGDQPEVCRICEDPRQFFPREGQQWTSLRNERGKHETAWKQDEEDDRIWHLYVDPKLGIGERASLVKTPHGNILWDLFAYFDTKLIDFINSQGRLHAIVISHPHFYTTHLTWAAALNVPVYTSSLDAHWLNRADPHNRRRALASREEQLLPGVKVVRTGGHFEGSTVLLFDDRHLFVADAVMVTPAGLGGLRPRPDGHSWFSFMWSIPNMIPLGPAEIAGVWEAIVDLKFDVVHGLMMGMDVRDAGVKGQILKSAKGQLRRMGWVDHPLLLEEA